MPRLDPSAVKMSGRKNAHESTREKETILPAAAGLRYALPPAAVGGRYRYRCTWYPCSRRGFPGAVPPSDVYEGIALVVSRHFASASGLLLIFLFPLLLILLVPLLFGFP